MLSKSSSAGGRRWRRRGANCNNLYTHVKVVDKTVTRFREWMSGSDACAFGETISGSLSMMMERLII
jgi:hypothetical protein